MADCRPVMTSSSNGVAIVGADGFRQPHQHQLQQQPVLNCTVNVSFIELPLTASVGSFWTYAPSLRYNVVHLVATALVLGVIILTTIVGNVFVIAAIVLERNLRNVANYLIASLAVADLMVAALVMPLAAVNEVSAGWFLGSEACDAFVLFDVICCTASILHLVAISLDRYWAVSRVDYIHNRSARRILTMIGASWSVSALISVPPLFGPRDPLDNPELTGVCLISQDWGYTVFSTIGAFYLPLLAMFVIYARIYRTARRRIRKHNFRRGPYSGAAGFVVAAAERLRDGASVCGGGVVTESPTPQPLLGKMFFRSISTPVDRQTSTTTAVAADASGTTRTPNRCFAVDDTDGSSTATGTRGVGDSPPSKKKNGLVMMSAVSIDEDGNDDAGSASATGTLDEDDRNNYCAATAVGNACSIIIAAAAATPQQQQQQQDDSAAATTAPSPPSSADIRSPPMPFFVRFINRRAGWFAMTAAARGQRTRYKQQLSTSSEVGFFPTAGNNDSDDGTTTMTYVAAAPTASSSAGSPGGLMASGTDVDFRGQSRAGNAATMSTAVASRRAREKQEQKRERKATRTLAIVTGTFVGCWLPFFILALVRPFCGNRCHYPPLLVSVIAWLGYVNSLLNPVIYTIFNPDFRSAFRKILFGKYRGSSWRHGQMHALQHLPFGRR